SVMPAQSADTEKLTQYWITAAPWQNKDIYDVALISGASLVRENIYGVIVASNDPDFTQTAYKNGAFLVLNPIVKGSCT
ncbi:MAG: hypothetical protein GWN00_30370, partial [Aliifodinibius sp.]|nr:hypothetical protein [Fodinibius sp.]NIW48018.1 hypothetical protein [Gammaproteobacteria bacterium]NIY28936.1 hypothetical protein [Fodinibius sp.]